MHDLFLYFLLDKENKSYTVKPDGSVSLSSFPVPLRNQPIGWHELELSFDTVDKYFSNVKSLAVPLQYVLDGAIILRYLLYKGKGYEEEVYCVIARLNNDNGIHELEYRGRLDLSKAVDGEFGITVNAKEGSFQADLDANEDVTYELPLDAANGAIDVLFDGVDLYDKYNYEFYDADLPNADNTVGMVYLSNEGDSVGIAHGDQSIEDTNVQDYYLISANTPFYSINPIKGVNIKGNIKFNFQQRVNNGNGNAHIAFAVWTSAHRTIYLIPAGVYNILTQTFDFDITIDLAANERLFFSYGTVPLEANGYKVETGKVAISFTSRNSNSHAYALPPLVVANQLVKKWNTKYSVQSQWLTVHNNIVATSGDALRNLDNAVLKYSFSDWWDDYNKEYCLCMNIIGNVMYIEKREVRFAPDLSNVIFDLGSVADFTLQPEEKNIVNTIKIGWPDQQYDERNGKFEFNSTTEEKGPVTIKKAELNLIGKARGDSYGIEFIRGKLNNKDTTDNKGDNQVFLINIVPATQITDTVNIEYNAATNTLTLLGRGDLVGLFPDGTVFETVTTFVTSFNHFIFTVGFAIDAGGDLAITVLEAGPASTAFFPGNILFPARLKRVKYDTITGVPVPQINGIDRSDIPGAPYNIEEMTPKRRLLNWGSWLRGVYLQLSREKIVFQTSLKNAELRTTLNGILISEKADVPISKLAAPFFLNYRAKFTVQVPLTFSKTLSALNAAGIVKGVVNGTELFFLPVGKMTSKPATNEAQEWELILSANNDLETIQKLREGTLFITNGMNTLTLSILNPVHFNFYGKVLNARYKYKDLFDDWVHHRNDQFAAQPAYLQKWQLTDTIKLQAITTGMGQLELYIYDNWAKQVDVKVFNIETNLSVRLPAVLSQVEINVSDYDEGRYIFVIRSEGQNLAISEWQSFAEVQDGTYIIDYYNTYNKLSAYWANYKPSIRVEAIWGVEKGDGTSTDYKDETRLITLGSESFTSKTLYVGEPYGIPEWMQIKLNNITFLDRVQYEGTRYTRPAESKWEITEPNGYPLLLCSIELKRSSNNLNISVDGAGIENHPAVIYTVESEMFGQAPGVIDFEVKED